MTVSTTGPPVQSSLQTAIQMISESNCIQWSGSLQKIIVKGNTKETT